jgi:hypothetical protein
MATQYTDPMTEALMQQFLTGQTAQTDALNAIASRPQKQTQITTTAPVEFADMLARRNQIGAERAMLNEALKQRETFGYGLANALASMPAQQGAGSWLGDFARGFGSAFNARANAAIDRAKQDYESAQADLATALAFDKAMGDVQQQNIGYTAVPYATGKTGTTADGGAGVETISGLPIENFGRSVGYDPVANKLDFGPLTRNAASGEQLSIGNWLTVPGSNSLAKGLTEEKSADLQDLYGDITENILTGKVLNFIGKAGSIRIADTAEEQETILGPIRGYKDMSAEQLNRAIERSRNNFVSLAVKKGVPAEEAKVWYNSAFTVPKSLRSETMYNIQDMPKETTTVGGSVSDWDNDDFWAGLK